MEEELMASFCRLTVRSSFNLRRLAGTKSKICGKKNCEGFEKWEKESASIGFFIGALGVGKTRTLLELKTILPCGENYVYVSFNGDTVYSPEEEHATICSFR